MNEAVEGLNVFIRGLCLEFAFLNRKLDYSLTLQGKHVPQEVLELRAHTTAITEMHVEGNTNDELQELNELHVVVLRGIDRLVNHGHLSQIELHRDRSLRQKAAHGFEELLG